MIILGHGSFTFKDLNGDSFLVILIGSEDLRLLGGEDGTSFNNLAHDTSDSLNTKREGSSVNHDNVLGERFFTTNDTTLDSSTEGNSLIGVNTSVEFLSEEFLN